MNSVLDFPRPEVSTQPRTVQEASRFAGPDHYSRLEDGRWTLSRGTEGSWWGFDPRSLLEGVLQANSGVQEVEAGRFLVEFDIERLGPLLNPGLHPGWRATGEVIVDALGAVASASLFLDDRQSSERGTETRFAFAWRESPPVIDLPPASATISVEQHLEEVFGKPWAEMRDALESETIES
jgi:hypothetical protein